MKGSYYIFLLIVIIWIAAVCFKGVMALCKRRKLDVQELVVFTTGALVVVFAFIYSSCYLVDAVLHQSTSDFWPIDFTWYGLWKTTKEVSWRLFQASLVLILLAAIRQMIGGKNYKTFETIGTWWHRFVFYGCIALCCLMCLALQIAAHYGYYLPKRARADADTVFVYLLDKI